MKIGYPCINRSIGCLSSRTFRLKSYSEERLIETVGGNLECLLRTLRFNVERGLLFFRITSDLVPFASHPVCRFDWRRHFRKLFKGIGAFIRTNRVRVSMHPDQFTLINSLSEDVLKRSVAELRYHAAVLDQMGLDLTARIQIHVGGVYGDRKGSMQRFEERYSRLPLPVRRRLVVENDEKSYSLRDCLKLHERTGIPVVCDVFHHRLLNHGENIREALRLAGLTWKKRDGLPIVDYSTQASGKRRGSHAASIRPAAFKRFLSDSKPFDFDLMLEIKDKEKSALRALRAASADPRLNSR